MIAIPLTASQKRLRNVVMLLALGSYLMSMFHRVAPGAIARDLATAFETSAASLGVLAAAYFYILTLMQIPTGVLADTLGPRIIPGACRRSSAPSPIWSTTR